MLYTHAHYCHTMGGLFPLTPFATMAKMNLLEIHETMNTKLANDIVRLVARVKGLYHQLSVVNEAPEFYYAQLLLRKPWAHPQYAKFALMDELSHIVRTLERAIWQGEIFAFVLYDMVRHDSERTKSIVEERLSTLSERDLTNCKLTVEKLTSRLVSLVGES